MDVINFKNDTDNVNNISNVFTIAGCMAGLAAYDISKRVFQPSNSNGGCITRTGYYVLIGSIALAVGQRVSKFTSQIYNNCKSGANKKEA